MEIKTLGEKIFMCETWYRQGVFAYDIRTMLTSLFGPLETNTILQGWKQFRRA
jgi:hypothetical protein